MLQNLLKNPYRKSFVLLEEAYVAICKGDLDDATTLLDQVQDLLSILRSPWYFVKYHYLRGVVAKQREEHSLALKNFQKAANMGERCSAREYLWRALGGMGELYLQMGEYLQAQKVLIRAMEVLRQIWQELPEEFQKVYLSHPQRWQVKKLLKKAIELAKGKA